MRISIIVLLGDVGKQRMTQKQDFRNFRPIVVPEAPIGGAFSPSLGGWTEHVTQKPASCIFSSEFYSLLSKSNLG